MAGGETELRALMIRGLDGDGVAHNALLTALAPLLRRFFERRMFNTSADVEDLVQETLIAIHTRRASYDRTRPFGSWAYAVARYKLIDSFRRRKATVSIDDVGDLLVTEAFDDSVGARLDVDQMLDTLPPKQARAIRATKIDGLTVEEAALRDQMSASDVKVSVHRGLKALAKRLGGARA